MEAIIFDLGNIQNQSTNLNTQKDIPKTKDFSSTLESQSKKTENQMSSKKTSKATEDSKNVKTDGQGVEENEETSIKSKDENVKNDYSLVYGNMLFLLNNELETEEPVTTEEVDMTLEMKQVVEPLIEYKPDVDALEEIETATVLEQHEKVDLESKMKFQANKEMNVEDNNMDMEFAVKTHTKLEEKPVKENDVENKEVDHQSSKIAGIQLAEEDKKEFDLRQNNEFGSSSSEDRGESEKINSNKEIEPNKGEVISLQRNDFTIIRDKVVESENTEVVNHKDIVDQVVEKFRVNLSDSKNEIRIKLKPEVLGDVTMNIEVIKGAVTAKIMVDNQKTKEIIEANLFELKEGIKDKGLEIKTFEVFVGSNSDFDKHNSKEFNFKQNNKKIKIKSQGNKNVRMYDEHLIEAKSKSDTLYPDSNLNLLA